MGREKRNQQEIEKRSEVHHLKSTGTISRNNSHDCNLPLNVDAIGYFVDNFSPSRKNLFRLKRGGKLIY